ncbi:MAG TPA: NADH-quinone oxidoreductase subunit C [Spirochaetia bacterium]|nr:NADH-quinone oxidoreductase subunit C [Spirochaetia bacterium]
MENCKIIDDFSAAWPQLALGGEHTCQVPAADLPAVATWWREAGARLADAFALADPAAPEQYLVRYVFEVPGTDTFISLQASVSGECPAYPAVSLDLHAADWFEREIFELYGILPQGHPALGGFVLHNQGDGGPFPLRKAFSRSSRLTAVSGAYRSHPVEGRGVFEMPLGPVYAGVSESIHFALTSIGEEVFWVTPHLFFKHRGFEKAGEDISLEGVLQMVRRLSGIGAVSESLALCQAVEKAASLEVPPRALYMRSLLAELERLYNHIGNIADICESTSLAVGAAQGFMLRERLLRLNCLLSGSRYLMNTVCFGGVLCDLGPDRAGLLRETLKPLAHDFRGWFRMLLNTDSFLDRLENIGVLNTADATNLGATGPVGRASGIDRDWRRDHAYAAYDRMEFRVPVENDGDGLARLKVRATEVEESFALVEQLVSQLPGGPVQNGTRPELSPGAAAMGYSEGPRGATLHWVCAGEDNRLWRVRLRPPSLLNWHAFPSATEGCAFQDFPIILASFGLSLAESDR